MRPLYADWFDVVDALYAAALYPRHWDDALGALARLCGAEAAGIRIEGAALTLRGVGFDAKFNAAYAEHYWRDDPWAIPSRSLTAGTASFGEMIVPRKVLERSAFYNELSKPSGLDDMVGGVIERSSQRLVGIGVFSGSKKRFDDREKQLIERLIPHIGRAISIGERLLCIPLTEQGSARPTLEERLRLTYGLTPAEAKVAIHIGQGLVPKEAAVALGTSWNTVRTQLCRVFTKTHTKRQTELARLLQRLERTP